MCHFLSQSGLYIVRFLHQTTTVPCWCKWTRRCISSVSYIKPQPPEKTVICPDRCISSVSYIKPQLLCNFPLPMKVVYRPFPTSNHNLVSVQTIHYKLYIVRFLHQTTTPANKAHRFVRLYIVRFLHQTTTILIVSTIVIVLYIVRFLHQTTTKRQRYLFFHCCISSVSYIKPQLLAISVRSVVSCISSVSYIKPQLNDIYSINSYVVYRPFPTSNHNNVVFHIILWLVVYRPFPTSNHNLSNHCLW